MSRYFPLFVDLEQKKIVVVGAGRIAERRIQTLLSFEAQITVIAPEASRENPEACKRRPASLAAGTLESGSGELSGWKPVCIGGGG